MRIRPWLAALVLGALALAAACSLNPQPLPPGAAPKAAGTPDGGARNDENATGGGSVPEGGPGSPIDSDAAPLPEEDAGNAADASDASDASDAGDAGDAQLDGPVDAPSDGADAGD